MSSDLSPLLWLVAVAALIPTVLWMLRRAVLPRALSAGAMRTVGQLPLSTTQRLLAVEVGEAAERRWLVLGVTPSSITLLTTLTPPVAEVATSPESASAPRGFARVLRDVIQVREGHRP